jgi:hypothetical protein
MLGRLQRSVLRTPAFFVYLGFLFSKTVPGEAFIGFPFGPSTLLKIIGGIFGEDLVWHVFFN